MGLMKAGKEEVVYVYGSTSISGNQRVYTFDRTYEEIASLLDDDCSVILNFQGNMYFPTFYSPEGITFLNCGYIGFEALSINTENNVIRSTLMFAVKLFTIHADSSITVSSYFNNIDDYIIFNTAFIFTDEEGNFLRLNFSTCNGSQYIFYYDNCNDGYRYVFTIDKSTLTCQTSMFNMNLTPIS